MSRPIAYNASGPLSGSIRGGSVNYTVDSGNRDYTTFASKKWVPSADGAAPIVFVTDTYTQGFELNPSLAVPLFYSCNGTGSAAIIYTANRIPGSPGNYSDANVALNDLITARGYFILESNDPFEGVDADNLTLDIDASKMSSYPQTGTNWRDLSGNGFNTTLVNGPTFQTGGWFNLDGTDDRIQRTSNILTTTTGTVVMWLRTTDQTWLMIEGNTNGYYLGAIYFGGAWYNNACGSPSYFVDTKNSTNPTSEGYIDGRFHMFEAKDVDLSGWTTHQFLDYNGGSGFNMAGDVAKIQMYNKNLTAVESKQNYFGSPIVTDGLVFAVDANNIVSYSKSGTSWYSLTGSVNNGTLTNGPTFNINNGGSIVFDGTDDFANFGSTGLDFGTGNFNVSCWIKTSNQSSSDYMGVVSKYDNATNTGLWIQLTPTNRYVGFGWDGGTYLISTTSVNNGAWRHISCQRTGATTAEIYVDGVLVSSGAGANTNSNTTVQLDIGRINISGRYFDGTVANTKIYNKALSASEILQNYQAEQYRFEGPAGPVTNGLLLYWDAGNLDSYPGTGTTIYDLSGNGNNGTLVNGVGYNQTNGGVLVFDGIDDYVAGGPNLAATNYTVMGAGRYVSIPYVGPPYGAGRLISSNSNNWLLGMWGGSTENYYAEGWVSSVAAGTSNTSWRIWTGTGDISGDSYSVYVNNSLTAGPNTGGSQGPNGFSIGRYAPGGDEYSNSNLGFLLAYNRVLTAAEMTQNYNYFKGRFGL